MDDESLMRDVENRLESLPINYLKKYANFSLNSSSTKCGSYPNIHQLKFNNIYWQTLQTNQETFQLFGAYYDIRKASEIGPTVRVLSMIDRIKPQVKTFCQFWFDSQMEPIIVETFKYDYIWHDRWDLKVKGIYRPYLIACRIPIQYHGVVPDSVSIVENKCDLATNNLRVIYNRPPDGKKKNFAVCVKGLDLPYSDLSVRLVEWFEMLDILGADKIFVYELHVHPNISKVFKHYERIGKVQVSPFSLAGGQPNLPSLQHLFLAKNQYQMLQYELFPYNDCLYKNMYMYDFLAVLDIDEFIMPMKDMTWPELMTRIQLKAQESKQEIYGSYNFRNVYFLDEHQKKYGLSPDIPKYLHMLQHVHRSKNFAKPGYHVKCFHDTEHVLGVHNHYPISCLSSECPSFSVSTEDGQLQHYRADCVPAGASESCEDFIMHSVADTTIWKYKDELINRSVNTLKTLGFFRDQTTNNIFSKYFH